MTFVALLLAFIGSYLLGSVAFGVVAAKLMGLGNLRAIGSGNTGATNVLRTGNKLAAFLTLAGDMGKGVVAVLLAREFAGEPGALMAATGAFIGHLYPIWHGFKGGKGVATFLGVVLALSFFPGIASCVTWLIVAAMTRISSAAALVASMLAPLWIFASGDMITPTTVLGLALLVWVRHRENIVRLLAGKEPRIGQKS